MRVLFQCGRLALTHAWRRRTTLLSLLLTIWLPVYALLAFFPKSGRFAVPATFELFLEGLAGLLWYGALLHLLRADASRHPIGARMALRRSCRSFPRLFGLHFVLGTRVAVGLLALMVPGLVMLVRYAAQVEGEPIAGAPVARLYSGPRAGTSSAVALAG